MEGFIKYTYLNTRSLHKHIDDVRSSHNITSADVSLFAETQLKEEDKDDNYKITSFNHILRNDQTYSGKTRPPHGLIAYVKSGIQVLEEYKYTSKQFEAIHMCIHQTNQLVPIQIIGLYISPHCTFQHFVHVFQTFMQHIDTMSSPTVILGDFNMKSITKSNNNYNQRLEQYMLQEYNMRQYITEPTHDDGSTLDLCFSTHNIEPSVIWNHWSDHCIIAINVTNLYEK